MSVTSGFFDSSNGDRRYTAKQFSALIDNLITDGVFATVGEAFAVSAAGSMVNIGVGRAWFNSTWIYNDTLLPMAILGAEMVQDRIDAVVIEINRSESVRAGSIKMVRGTPSSTQPQRPVLTNTDEIHQYPLAYVYRKAGVGEITSADVTNMIGTSSCPFVTGILQTIDIDHLFSQWQGEFDAWFSELEDMLDGDQATELASRILDLEAKFQTLAMERAVYTDLLDSSNQTIQDSSGRAIEVATRFPEVGNSGTNPDPAISVEDSFKVGDILETARTDLGYNWLLCNGAEINRNSYLSLGDLIPSSPLGEYTILGEIWTADSNLETGLNDIVFANGYYIVAGFVRPSSSSCEARIAYATTPSGPWTPVTLWTSIDTSNNGDTAVHRIKYVNGLYFALGSRKDSSSRYQYTRAAYSSDLIHWTDISISMGANAYAVFLFDIVYANEYYTILGEVGASYYIWSSKAPNGSWTSKSVTTASDAGKPGSLFYLDGKYIVSEYEYYSSRYRYRIFQMQTDDPTSGSFTVAYEVGDVSGDAVPLAYIDGAYAFIINSYNANVSILYYSLDLTSGWVRVDLPFLVTINNNGLPKPIQFLNGYYILPARVGSENGLIYSRFLDGPWAFKSVTDISDINNYAYSPSNIAFHDNTFCIAGRGGNDYRTWIGYTDNTKLILPSISHGDSTYVYIKAKE